MSKWVCDVCSFEYDEALGLPEDEIPAETKSESSRCSYPLRAWNIHILGRIDSPFPRVN